jgi:hypothetical protein
MADELDDTDPDVLRDRLLEQTERGDITEKQAEEAAAARGLEPFARKPELPRFDPKLKSHWSIVMAVAWIAWRDSELVREQDPEFCSACFHWIYRKWKDPSDKTAESVERAGYFLETRPPPTVSRLALLDVVSRVRGNVPSTAVMTIREAEAALWHASSEGRLIAEGINADGSVVEIPSREWAYLQWREEAGRDVLRYETSRTEPFTAVTLRRSDLLRLWPVTGEFPAIATKAHSSQVDRIKLALSIKFPDGVSPNLTDKEVRRRIEPIFKKESWKLASIDSVARARGRRKIR